VYLHEGSINSEAVKKLDSLKGIAVCNHLQYRDG
jgi:hypothetical protein